MPNDKVADLEIKSILNLEDIPSSLQNTPIETLLKYQNFNEDFAKYETPELIVVMCMDNRKQLHIPNKFSFIIRSPGARVIGFEFALSFPIAIANIQHVALIAHTDCGMIRLTQKREQFITGLTKNAGWTEEEATNHFNSFAPFYEIDNEVRFIYEESLRLKTKYPNITFVPMLYKVHDHKVYLVIKTDE